MLALAFSIVPVCSLADATGVCFIAVNETLLDLNVTPYFYGSAYVPYSVFGNFQIYSSFFRDSNTLSLYRSDRQLYFNLNNGQVYDGDNNYYTTSIITLNGQYYVPVQFVCNFFDLSWSHIQGIGYGDVLRITDGSRSLSDSEFLQGATSMMKSRYEAYIAANPPSVSPSPEVSDDPQSGVSAGIDIYLSFAGLPDSGVLDILKAYNAPAVFYLSPQDIQQDPDTVRRIVAEGHSVGILCSQQYEYDYVYGSELLFEAAMVSTFMVSASASDAALVQSYAELCGLSYSGYDILAAGSAGYISSAIESCGNGVVVRFNCGDGTAGSLAAVLRYLHENRYDLLLMREV